MSQSDSQMFDSECRLLILSCSICLPVIIMTNCFGQDQWVGQCIHVEVTWRPDGVDVTYCTIQYVKVTLKPAGQSWHHNDDLCLITSGKTLNSYELNWTFQLQKLITYCTISLKSITDREVSTSEYISLHISFWTLLYVDDPCQPITH